MRRVWSLLFLLLVGGILAIVSANSLELLRHKNKQGNDKDTDLHLRVVRLGSRYVILSWEGDSSTTYTVEIKGTGDHPTPNDCTVTDVTNSTNSFYFDSRDHCHILGVCKDMTVTVTDKNVPSNTASTGQISTAPSEARVITATQNGNELSVEWTHQANPSYTYCFNRALLTTATPKREYLHEFTSLETNNKHSPPVTSCDTGHVTVKVEVFGEGISVSDPVSNSMDYQGQESVLSSVVVSPRDSRSVDASWSVEEECHRVSEFHVSWSYRSNLLEVIDNSTTTDETSLTISDTPPCTYLTVTVQPLEGGQPLTKSKNDSAKTEPEAPESPSSVAATKVNNQSDSLTVSWINPPAPGNCLIHDTNTIFWRLAGTDDSYQQKKTTGGSPQILSGLDIWTSYTVCVDAETTGGPGDKSCGDGRTDQDIPGPPVIKAVTPTTSSLKVTWSAPETPNGVITDYTVTWIGFNDTLGGNGTQYTIPNLPSCTPFTVSVSAATIRGFGDPSEEVSKSTSVTAPEQPKAVSANMIFDASDQLEVSWTGPDAPGPECPIIHFQIKWKKAEDDESQAQKTDVDGDITSETLENLDAWTLYTVCVSAQTIAGYGAEKCDNRRTDEDTPGPPANTKVEPQSATSLQVTWNSPPLPKGVITKYNVSWISDEGKSGYEVQDNNTTHLVINDLKTCTNYSVSVRAATSKGFGEEEDEAQGSTGGDAPPAPPKVECQNPTSDTVTLTWEPSPTKCILVTYSISYSGSVLWSDEKPEGTFSVPAATTTVIHDGLKPWTEYKFCAAGIIVGGTVGDKNCCSTTTSEAAPGPPRELSASKAGPNTIELSWEAPQEVNGNLTQYRVLGHLIVQNSASKVVNYTLGGLHPQTTYNISVEGCTGGGWGTAAFVVETTNPKDVDVPAIVGSVLAAVLVIGAAIAAFIYRDRLKSTCNEHKRRLRKDSNIAMHKTTLGSHNVASINKNDLSGYIQSLENKMENGLEEEFELLKAQSPKYSTEAASKIPNLPKNRFKDIHPFDHARVKLTEIPGEPDSSYINASYIQDIHERPYFIAAQGPKPNTIGDFLKLIWEQNARTIVMVTNLVEMGRTKCEQYWPEAGGPPLHYDQFTLINQREEEGQNHVTRYIEIIMGDHKRLLKQYHFTSWPDHGAPNHEDDLLAFITSIRGTMTTTNDHIVVHCSAGVGRTGTFIGLWNLMDSIDSDRNSRDVNIREAILNMREARPYMVQSKEQYLYLCKCVAAYIETPDRWSGQPAGGGYNNRGYEDAIYENF